MVLHVKTKKKFGGGAIAKISHKTESCFSVYISFIVLSTLFFQRTNTHFQILEKHSIDSWKHCIKLRNSYKVSDKIFMKLKKLKNAEIGSGDDLRKVFVLIRVSLVNNVFNSVLC